MIGYQLRLPGFEGPLDLLLQLIERRQMDVTAVSLAQVTEQYLEYLWSLGEIDLDAWSSFLVVAARLLLLKSRRLLPQPGRQGQAPQEEPEGDGGEALIRQLLEFRRYRPAVALLRGREEQRLRSYPRLAPPPRPTANPLQGLVLADLQAALRRALERREPVPVVVQPPTVDIGQRIRVLQEGLEREGTLAFARLLAGCTSRLEVVVTFLALLELIKRGRVAARQEGSFADIVIEAVASQIAPEVANNG